jgi:hypothetical protein
VRLADIRMKLVIEQEERRQAEVDARAAKVGKMMGHMEDTVIKQQKEQERLMNEKLKKQ